MENIIQKGINTEKLNFFNNSLNNIKYGELVIIENEKLNIKSSLNLKRLGKRIKIVPYSQIERDSLYNYFLFKKINIVNDSAFIRFYHNFENFDCEITMKKEDNKWKEKKVLIIQY